MAQHSNEFHLWVLNEIWRTVYIVSVIYLFFEFTLPHLIRKRILRFILLLLFQIFLFSFGLFMWREIGIGLGIHTAFISYDSCLEGVGDQFGSSLFAILLFAIVRHIYNYIQLKSSA